VEFFCLTKMQLLQLLTKKRIFYGNHGINEKMGGGKWGNVVHFI
jgi:hypothetical protein